MENKRKQKKSEIGNRNLSSHTHIQTHTHTYSHTHTHNMDYTLKETLCVWFYRRTLNQQSIDACMKFFQRGRFSHS